MFLYSIFEGIICFFLTAPFFFVLVSQLFTKKGSKTGNDTSKIYDFACVITAYKDASIAINLVKSILAQKHPNFHIYLVADDCDITNIHFDDPIFGQKVSVFSPQPLLKSKVKSILFGMEKFVRKHEAILIFDPDNLAHPDCMVELNRFFNMGYKGVQGRRTAKNLDTFYACLDATGEFYYNYTTKLVPYRLGSSATIAGSGMAFLSEFYIDFLQSEEIQGPLREGKVIVAEDKMLQVDFVGKKHVIAFAWDSIIYDEKVSSGVQVERQRTRWLNSYFLHLKDGFGLFWKGLLNFNFNQIYFAYTIVIPPLFLQVGAAMLLLAINLFFFPVHFFIVAGSLAIFILNFLLVLALSKAPTPIWQSLWRLPWFVSKQVLALFKMGKSNKDFLVTEKQSNISLEDVI